VDSREQPSLAGALDALWTRFLPEMEARVATLESAAQAFAANSLSEQQQEQANTAAHKLAGVLGTFGLTRGTVLARELEMMYSQENGRDPAQAAQLSAIAAELRSMLASRK
jgi:HPt (histidine-containing phosphotransfer) domain-containing protein